MVTSNEPFSNTENKDVESTASGVQHSSGIAQVPAFNPRHRKTQNCPSVIDYSKSSDTARSQSALSAWASSMFLPPSVTIFLALGATSRERHVQCPSPRVLRHQPGIQTPRASSDTSLRSMTPGAAELMTTCELAPSPSSLHFPGVMSPGVSHLLLELYIAILFFIACFNYILEIPEIQVKIHLNCTC